MVSVHYCILLIAVSSSWQRCETAGEYVELNILKGGNYERKSCDLFTLENPELLWVYAETASYGCYCQLLLAKEGTLYTISLTRRKLKSYNASADGSRQFTFAVSVTNSRDYIYFKQGDHLQDWQYDFVNEIGFMTDANFEWLNCTAVSQMYIANLVNPPTTPTDSPLEPVTSIASTDLALEPITSTTSTDLPLEPVTSTTESALPVSEKPRQSQKKALIIGVVIGVALLMMVIVVVLVFLICFILWKRRLKSLKEVSKVPYVTLFANTRDITLIEPIDENIVAASVNNRDTERLCEDQVEFESQANITHS